MAEPAFVIQGTTTTTATAASALASLPAYYQFFLGAVGIAGVGLLAFKLYKELQQPLGIVFESPDVCAIRKITIDNGYARCDKHSWSLQTRDGDYKPAFEKRKKLPLYILPTWSTAPIAVTQNKDKADSKQLDSATLDAKLNNKLMQDMLKLSITDMLNAPNLLQIILGIAIGLLAAVAATKLGWWICVMK